MERLIAAVARRGAATLAVRRTAEGGLVLVGGVKAWHLPPNAPGRLLDEVRAAADLPIARAPCVAALEVAGSRVHVDFTPTFDGEKATLVLGTPRDADGERSPDLDLAETFVVLVESLHGGALTPEDALILAVAARNGDASLLLPRLADQVVLALARRMSDGRHALDDLAARLLAPPTSRADHAARAEPLAELLRFGASERAPADLRAAARAAAETVLREAARRGAPGLLPLAGLVAGLLPPGMSLPEA